MTNSLNYMDYKSTLEEFFQKKSEFHEFVEKTKNKLDSRSLDLLLDNEPDGRSWESREKEVDFIDELKDFLSWGTGYEYNDKKHWSLMEKFMDFYQGEIQLLTPPKEEVKEITETKPTETQDDDFTEMLDEILEEGEKDSYGYEHQEKDSYGYEKGN